MSYVDWRIKGREFARIHLSPTGPVRAQAA